MIVLKFGGSSVASADTIKQVHQVLVSRLGSTRMLVVFSAFQGITNQLLSTGTQAAEGDPHYRDALLDVRNRHLRTAAELLGPEASRALEPELESMLTDLDNMCYGAYLVRELSPRTQDYIVSFGERLSTTIIAAYFAQQNVPTRLVQSTELIHTDAQFTNAQVDLTATYAHIKQELGTEDKLMVVQGFIGSNKAGETTTLGRGGSDYSAAIFAHALEAEAMEKWTDVSGMLTSDPRIVPTARVIQDITYAEAMELCHFGAKVIYPPTIHPLMEKGIPLRVRNTFKPEDAGTTIGPDGASEGSIKGLSSIGGIALITLSGGGMVGIPGFSRRMFSALSYRDVNVILITQASSEYSITVAIEESHVPQAVSCLEEEFELDMSRGKINPVGVETGLSIVALVGDNMRHQVGLSGRAMYQLGKNGINILAIAQGSSERNISLVIDSADVAKSLNTLHEGFFDAEIKRLHLFLAGVGNVGGALIAQLAAQQQTLLEEHGLHLVVSGMANSRKRILDADGIDLSTWESRLAEGEDTTIDSFVEGMKALNLRNSVFVDNTAHANVAEVYETVLESSIAVVCSNKIAASASQERYQGLLDRARRYNTQFRFETNVGAGLPIIDTLQNLIKSGDRIRSVQAVLSGSLNFVFNNFSADTTFEAVVRQAMDEGYTEPDPRIDLSGVDVQRKILILARESGHRMEMGEVTNVPFLPAALMEGDVDAFLGGLPGIESMMQKKLAAAAAQQYKLKYMAQFKNGQAEVGLQEVGPDHPFYAIEGKDNMVVIYTDRYAEQPLVIKGAGAGADVTASGVFADIIRIGNE